MKWNTFAFESWSVKRGGGKVLGVGRVACNGTGGANRASGTKRVERPIGIIPTSHRDLYRL